MCKNTLSGNEFQLTTNNCGYPAQSKQTISRERSFSITLESDISSSISGEIGGDVGVVEAKVSAVIERSFGVNLGSSEKIIVQREIVTPPDSISIITLRREEIWDVGSVSVIGSDEKSVGETPFRLLSTLQLTQVKIKEIPCEVDNPSTLDDYPSDLIVLLNTIHILISKGARGKEMHHCNQEAFIT